MKTKTKGTVGIIVGPLHSLPASLDLLEVLTWNTIHILWLNTDKNKRDCEYRGTCTVFVSRPLAVRKCYHGTWRDIWHRLSVNLGPTNNNNRSSGPQRLSGDVSRACGEKSKGVDLFFNPLIKRRGLWVFWDLYSFLSSTHSSPLLLPVCLWASQSRRPLAKVYFVIPSFLGGVTLLYVSFNEFLHCTYFHLQHCSQLPYFSINYFLKLKESHVVCCASPG